MVLNEAQRGAKFHIGKTRTEFAAGDLRSLGPAVNLVRAILRCSNQYRRCRDKQALVSCGPYPIEGATSRSFVHRILASRRPAGSRKRASGDSSGGSLGNSHRARSSPSIDPPRGSWGMPSVERIFDKTLPNTSHKCQSSRRERRGCKVVVGEKVSDFAAETAASA